jgi:hypothetical protein
MAHLKKSEESSFSEEKEAKRPLFLVLVLQGGRQLRCTGAERPASAVSTGAQRKRIV